CELDHFLAIGGGEFARPPPHIAHIGVPDNPAKFSDPADGPEDAQECMNQTVAREARCDASALSETRKIELGQVQIPRRKLADTVIVFWLDHAVPRSAQMVPTA